MFRILTLVYDENLLFARLGENIGFVIEAEFAPVVLKKIAGDYQFSSVNVVAENEEKLAIIKTWLPGAWSDVNTLNGPELAFHVGGYWEWVDPSMLAHPLDLRCGQFARQLPLVRWWSSWKWPSLMLLGAYVLAVIVTFGQYLQIHLLAQT